MTIINHNIPGYHTCQMTAITSENVCYCLTYVHHQVSAILISLGAWMSAVLHLKMGFQLSTVHKIAQYLSQK